MKRLAILGVVVAIPAAVFGTVLGRWLSVPQLAEPAAPKTELQGPLYIPDGAADVGEVWEAADAKIRIPVANRSDKPIRVIDAETGCDCSDIAPRSFTLLPGRTQWLELTMDLTKRSDRQIGMVRRPFTAKVSLVTKQGQIGERFTVNGVTVSYLTLNRLAINFGDANIAGKPPASSRKIIATSPIPGAQLICECDSKSVSVSTGVASAGQWLITVTANTNWPPGPFAGTVLISLVCNDGHSLGPIKLSVEGTLSTD